MLSSITRRRFLSQLGILSAGIPLAGNAGVLFNPMMKKGDIKFGYSAITWGGNDVQAIKDISSLGFTGIQLRSNAFTAYEKKPEEMKKLLDEAKLKLAMFSSGNADINTGKDEEVIATHVAHAKFVKALGGSFMQITNGSRPKERPPSAEELAKYGQLLTQIGKQTKPLGVEVTYHNHMGQLGQTPDEVEQILKATDPEYVSFLLDVAHYQQGGGDPAGAVKKYRNRLKALHIKDVRDKPASANGQNYVFVEIGQGRVDFLAIFRALYEVKFKGYAIIELDAVPDIGKTPAQCAGISKSYLKEKFQFDIG